MSTVTLPGRTGNSESIITRADLAAILPSAVAGRAEFEHFGDRTAASALRVLAELPDSDWHDAVHEGHIDFAALVLQRGWDLGRALMIRVAASFYGSPFAGADVRDLADLTPERFAAVMDALRIAREGLAS